MIVVDTSVVFDFCINSEKVPLLREVLFAGGSLVAPEIIELEFIQVLRRRLRKGIVDADQAETVLANFQDMNVTCFPHGILRERVWAMRENLTAYDAAFFALAMHVDAPLWTRDAKFARAPIPSVDVRVV